MIEAVISSLIESTTTLILGRVITIATKKQTKEMTNVISESSYRGKDELYRMDETADIPLVLKGDLGESLICAYEEFIETKDTQTIEEYLKKVRSDKEITLAVEISRKTESDVRIQLERPVEYLVSSVSEIVPNEFPSIARRISDFIQTINTVHKGPTIHLILSVPVVLGFQIGPFVGLAHFNIELYHFEKGRYLKVPNAKRDRVEK
ncbi:MAG: hypothetical protein C4291_10365 [Candidatus Dadabacteria bacterium]